MGDGNSEKISSGDLRGSIRVHAGNELADLGNVLNERMLKDVFTFLLTLVGIHLI